MAPDPQPIPGFTNQAGTIHKDRLFIRRCADIVTPGINWSGRLVPLEANGDYEIWKKMQGKCWAGNGSVPWAYVPPELWLVKVTGDRFTAVCVIEPGRYHKRVLGLLRQLLAWTPWARSAGR